MSFFEFVVYGLIGYGAMIMLLISTIKEIPAEKSGSISRIIYLLPGAICLLILGLSGDSIIMQDTITLNGTGGIITNSTAKVDLQNDVWVSIHMLFFIIIIFFVFYQIIQLLTKTDNP